jgi:two-component system chemotaxis response regulator CheB
MRRDVVVIGASAGGLPALTSIVGELPRSLPASLLVVVHAATDGSTLLPTILGRASALPAAFAAAGDRLAPGRIYVAPPDTHLIVQKERLSVVHGPRENGFRPAIDPLFRTAGQALGPRVIGVILSGALSDGTYGLSVIKQHGGTAIVQDPQDAIIPNMPQSAIQHVTVDYVLPAREIGATIERLVTHDTPKKEGSTMRRRTSGFESALEPQRQARGNEVSDMTRRFGPPSGLTCPDCGGALWEVHENDVVRYQCHVGHQYAPDNLDAGQREEIDAALWSAVRVLEEHAELKRRMARRSAEGGLKTVAQGFEQGAREAHEQAQRIRTALFAGEHAPAARGTAAASRPRPATVAGRPAAQRSDRAMKARRRA